ncbi:MAG: pseudouridine-5-phosphate glycosidase, partial [Chloroflexi bacterium]
MASLTLSADLEHAIETGKPIVALESAVITHGLPKTAAIDAVRRQWVACAEA